MSGTTKTVGKPMNPSIEIEHLSKSFVPGKPVLTDISLNIPQGSIFGFLGPNGSGKTTTIRTLNGIYAPDQGSARINGLDIAKDALAIRSQCGVMTETASLYENLGVMDNIVFFAQLYGLTKTDAITTAKHWLTEFDLLDHSAKRVKNLSTGMKKKLSLSIAILHKPSVLFLDEPTSGLDPEAARDVVSLIQKMSQEEKTTVFLCTHQLKYFEEICTLYGFIHKGRIIGSGTFHELLAQKKGSLMMEIRGENLPGNDPNLIREPVQDDKDAAMKIRSIINSGGTIFEARQIHHDLEDLYFAYQKDAEGTV